MLSPQLGKDDGSAPWRRPGSLRARPTARYTPQIMYRIMILIYCFAWRRIISHLKEMCKRNISSFLHMTHRPLTDDLMTCTYYSERNLLWRKQVQNTELCQKSMCQTFWTRCTVCVQSNALLKVKTLLHHSSDILKDTLLKTFLLKGKTFKYQYSLMFLLAVPIMLIFFWYCVNIKAKIAILPTEETL